MKSDTISIIIPAYNAEKTLKEAVKSVTEHNTATDYEIIIVENGSKDHTGKIAEQMAARYEQVRYIRSEKGVSKARNEGIRQANGQWLVFLDADDTMAENAIDIISKDIKNTVDLYIYSYMKNGRYIDITDGMNLIYQKDVKESRIEDIRALLIKNPTRFMAVWGKCFKKRVITDNNIYFDEELSMSEDSDFLIRYTKHCEEIVLQEDTVYNYTISENSAVHKYSGDKIDKYTESVLKTKEHIKDESLKIKEAFNIYVIMQFNLIMVHEVYSEDNKMTDKEKKNKIRQLRDMEPYKSAISSVKLSECNQARLIPVVFMRLNMYGQAAKIYKMRVNQNKKNGAKNG